MEFKVINSRTTRPQCKNTLVFLSRELGVDLNHSASFSYGFVAVGLGNGDLLPVLLLLLFKLGVLEVGLDCEPELEPGPGLGHHVGTDGALAGVQGHLVHLPFPVQG